MLPSRLRQSLLFIALLVVALLSTACSAPATPTEPPTPTPLAVITATLPPTQTPRPSATPAPPTPTVPVAPVEGQTTSQLNVRGGPSADSALLGQIQIFTKVQIVGKDPTSTWWMIVYPESPTGTGWVTAQYVQATNTENVPVFRDQAQPATQGAPATASGATGEAAPTAAAGSTESVQSPAPTLSLAAAFPDGDSAQSPSVSIALSKASVRSFNYSSDLSSPEGDPEDWVQFRLDGPAGQETTVIVVLNCTGSGAMSVELLQNNSALQSWQDMTCGQARQLILNLFVGAPYTLHIAPVAANHIQKYLNYTLVVTLQ